MSVSSTTSLIHGSSDDLTAIKRLAVAWQHPRTRRIEPVGLLTYEKYHDRDLYTFRYVSNSLHIADFRPFLSFPSLDRVYTSSRLFPLFSQRVMDIRRPDFERYVRSLDLSPEATPWEQIARSEGRRAGDTILVFPEPDVQPDGRTCSMFLVHGVRHVKDPVAAELALTQLRKAVPLELTPEPANPVNSLAICVTYRGVSLGWVPDLLLDFVHRVVESGYRLEVAHVNGPEAPMHLRLLVRLTGHIYAQYRPFTGGVWSEV